MDKLVLFSPQIEVLTPFAGYVDASRLNMASKQQNQCVISNNTDTPLVIDKNFKKLTFINSPFAEFAQEDGHIILVDRETMIIYYPVIKKLITKSIPPVKNLINNSLCLKYKAEVGSIKKGELLFDYTNMNTTNFMPKVGYRAKILFSSFFGYTADDAIVISESFAERSIIEYSQKIFVPITKEWKYLRNHLDNFFYDEGDIQKEEQYLNYFTIDAGEHFMSEIYNISEQQSMFFTKGIEGIKNGEIVSVKVHRNTNKTFHQLKKEYMYTPGLIQELEDIYSRNEHVLNNTQYVLNQLGLPLEKSIQLSEELFESYYSTKTFPKNFINKIKDEFNLNPDNVDFMLEISVNYKAKTTRGDKFTNLFAGKGTVSMIIPDEIMPCDPITNLPIDIIFNPLGIFGRNNWGSIFELGLSKIIEDVERIVDDIISTGLTNIKADKLIQRVKFINDNFISEYDVEYSKEIINFIDAIGEDVNSEILNEFINDINNNGFYIFAPNFTEMPYYKFYNNVIKKYADKFLVNMNKSNVIYTAELMGWLRDKWQYKNSILGSDSYEIDTNAFIGTNYILKLYHTSYSKYTSVSLANSYSKITGQPVRGRKKTGGQHISWQTLAALLGHKENNNILKELYTIKSDAPIKDKEKFIMEYITHGSYKLKPKYVSLTKRAVNNSLKMLGMQLED